MPKIRPYSSQSCITQLDFPTAESVAALWGTFSSPHSFHSGAGSQRPGAVKGAPFFGAAKRTLDGEDRCETITGGRKALSSQFCLPTTEPEFPNLSQSQVEAIQQVMVQE